uniref:small monomeric GTPase n=2 Tax=Hirondellea gigas TaxID=1518452 RepID=A0A6A7G3M8_9CRUS
MSGAGMRGIRRKKSSMTEVKIAVLGAPGVGKSALVVRFLTKRYIGEYDHQSEQRYRNEVLVDGDAVLFEILDTCNNNGETLPTPETLAWADGLLLVYSITDRHSFNWVKKCRVHFTEQGTWPTRSGGTSPSLTPSPPLMDVTSSVNPPMVLLGNKADMVHLRQVSAEEGEILAKDLECVFSEVAASDQVAQVAAAFQDLFREVQYCRKRCKTSLLDRVLGSKTGRSYVRGKSDSALPKD